MAFVSSGQAGSLGGVGARIQDVRRTGWGQAEQVRK